MPASKKRIKLRSAAAMLEQEVPAALRDWVHIWHGVRVQRSPVGGAIFHAGSRYEELSFWQQFVRLPSNSLFPRVDTFANPRRQYKDFLYVLLNLRWPVLGTALLTVFVVNIFAFAVVTCYGCGEPATFLHAFDLSYQTFTTIGFGIVFPQRTCSNVVMTLESFASMLVTSAITGLAFAKFAKPVAKIASSSVCVVQPYGKHELALVVRVANATQSRDVTHDVIMEANFKLNLLRIESSSTDRRTTQQSDEELPRPPPCVTFTRSSALPLDDRTSNRSDRSAYALETSDDEVETSGDDPAKTLRSYNLKVLQNNFITFRMGVAVVHVIDAASPLYGLSEAQIRSSDMVLEVAMSGVDSTLQDTVAERWMYTAGDFRWGYRFAELLDFDERNMEVIMDFAKLSAVEPAPIDVATYVAPAAAAVAARSSERPKRHGVDTTSRTTATAAAAAVAALTPIDELGAEDPEVFRRQRSVSDGSSIAQHVLKRGSSKCSLAMEPLFEPLLQRPVGTQRLAMSSSSTAIDKTAGASAAAMGRTRLGSGPSALERSGEFMIPMPQKQQIQSRLAGDAEPDDVDDDDEEDETSTVSDVDAQRAASDSDSDSDDDDGDGDDDAVAGTPRHKRRSHSPSNMLRQRSRNALSAVSIDVEDTPRFLKIAPLHIPKSYDFMRLYHSALYVRWPRIIGVFVLAFVAINTVFGLLYWLKSDGFVAYPEVTVSTFERAFFMSVHTLATIGYGSVAPQPQSLYMNFWVLIESSLGIIAVTIITGIAWSKFARPRAHIHFSSHVALCRIYGHRCLVFRAANTRHSGDVHENFFRIGVILTNRKTGLRQMYDVPLVTAEWPSIKLPATLIHIIDAASPFYKFHSVADLSASRVAVIVLLTGLDTTFSENVYARKMYFWDDFTCGLRFCDFARVERDRVVVDYEKFDALEPEASGDAL